MSLLSTNHTISVLAGSQDVGAKGWLAAAPATPIPVQSAQQWAEAADFHWHLAKSDQIRCLRVYNRAFSINADPQPCLAPVQ